MSAAAAVAADPSSPLLGPPPALRTTTKRSPPPPPAAPAMTSKPTVSPLVHLAAGGLGGCVGAIVTCPFEVVKTRLQSSHHVQLTRNAFFFAENNKPLTGTASIVRGIYAAEGLGAFWKGLGPTLAGVIPARATYFATYNESKRALTALNDGVESKRVVMGSAIGAGFFTTVLTSPIWLIKTRMQLQSSAPGTGAPPVYRNSVDCLVKVVRNEGVLSLYRGLSASLIGISEGTIQWLLYEELKRARIASRAAAAAAVDVDAPPRTTSLSPKTPRDWLEYFMCAASAKLAAATLTYPHEVVRTRMRESPSTTTGAYKYRSLVQTFNTIVREEGVRALYGGMGVHLLRVVPNSAIMFLCYEGVVHLAQTWDRASS